MAGVPSNLVPSLLRSFKRVALEGVTEGGLVGENQASVALHQKSSVSNLQCRSMAAITRGFSPTLDLHTPTQEIKSYSDQSSREEEEASNSSLPLVGGESEDLHSKILVCISPTRSLRAPTGIKTCSDQYSREVEESSISSLPLDRGESEDLHAKTVMDSSTKTSCITDQALNVSFFSADLDGSSETEESGNSPTYETEVSAEAECPSERPCSTRKTSYSTRNEYEPCCQKLMTRDSFQLRDSMCADLESAFEDKLGGIGEKQVRQYMMRLRRLTLEYCSRLTSLGSCIFDLASLLVLELKGCSALQELPPEIKNLTALQTLDVSECQKLKRLPASMFTGLKALQELNLCGCTGLDALPESIGLLIGRSLRVLRLASCESLASLPDSIAYMTSLVLLDLCGCGKIRELPKNIVGGSGAVKRRPVHQSRKPRPLAWQPSNCATTSLKHKADLLPHIGIKGLTSLDVLNMNACLMLEKLPPLLGNLAKLRVLSLKDTTGLKKLPDSITDLTELRYLSLEGCSQLATLPSKFGKCLSRMQTLLLVDCCGLLTLPESFCAMASLRELDMSGCSSLEKLPQGFGWLGSLRRLKLANCESLAELPSSMCGLQALEELDLHGCHKLQELPGGVGNLGCLQKLDLLSCSSLKEFPRVGDSGLAALEELDMRGTPVEEVLSDQLYFADARRVRSFLTFCNFLKDQTSNDVDARVEWILWPS